jgi:prepilin-type N-terminal cleavage/methylation domain-containing protein
MKERGFTLIELMIVVAIVGILAAMIAPYLSGNRNEPGVVSNGVKAGGLSCVGGFLFSTDANGNTRPATDAEGKASKC